MMILHSYNFLKQIEARPGMWIGDETLKSLSSCLCGYYYALIDYELIKKKPQQEEPNFHHWVANKLGFYESAAGWPNMILAVTLGLNPQTISWNGYATNVTREQHKLSIKRFYELLEEFVQEADATTYLLSTTINRARLKASIEQLENGDWTTFKD